MTKSFKIITLGCKVNQYESAYLDEALSDAGCQKADRADKADISIINTCIVTQTASHQSRQAIRKAIRENSEGTVVATGCYAQAFPGELSEIEGIRLIAGNAEKATLPELLLGIEEGGQERILSRAFEPGTPFDFLPIKRFSDRTRAFLKIQDGCQSFCSYCIVPLARGPYRSLSPQKVLSMIKTLAQEGYKEIVLTGIHLGKYGVDLKNSMNLNRLLVSIDKEHFPVRIRLSSLEINEIDTALIDMMASKPWLCRHFHIPLQSGDDGVLKKMNRKYTARHFAKLIESIHDKVPLAAMGIDVMSGFPGEDTAAHQNTYSLIKDLPVSYLHVFPFSPRPGTPAATFDGRIDSRVIKQRAAALRQLGQGKKLTFYQKCLNKEFMVLPEGWHPEKEGMMKGKSDNYLPVLFPSSEDLDRLVPVVMESVEGNMVLGTMPKDNT
jgi:threonylcarbamoyladenosine tRNA methylthiotransferase MtaB